MTYSNEEWLAEWRSKDHFLEWTGLARDAYEAALEELVDLRDRVGLDTSKGSRGPLALRPAPGVRLARHPLPVLLALRSPDQNIWCDLTGLGLALAATRDLEGIKSKRTNLAKPGEYLSTLFEIEVLAALVGVGLKPTIRKDTPDSVVVLDGQSIGLEMKLKEAPTGIALVEGVFRSVIGIGIEMPGTIRIRLKRGAAGGAQQFVGLLRSVITDLNDMREQGGACDRREYVVGYDPSRPENSIEVTSEDGQTFEQFWDRWVSSAVHEKDLKLAGIAVPTVVALDLRSVGYGFFPEGSRIAADPYYQRQLERSRERERRAAVVAGLQGALGQAAKVRAVVGWWRRRGLSPREALFRPWEITWTTSDRHVGLTEDPEGLVPLLRSLL